MQFGAIATTGAIIGLLCVDHDDQLRRRWQQWRDQGKS